MGQRFPETFKDRPSRQHDRNSELHLKARKRAWRKDAGVGRTPLPKPTLTNAETEETEDKVSLGKAAEDWPEGEAHGEEENETQGQGEYHEAHAHMDENWGGGEEMPQSQLQTFSKVNLQVHPH